MLEANYSTSSIVKSLAQHEKLLHSWMKASVPMRDEGQGVWVKYNVTLAMMPKMVLDQINSE